MYDLTVIGGGPAGATCARIAAEAGLDVLLIEKAHHPRKKPCGGAIGPRALPLIGPDVSQVSERTFHAAVVYTPAGRRTVLTSKDLFGHLVKRETFDSYLLQKARDAGAEVVEGVEIVGIEQLRSGIRALAVGDSYKSHLLVGADGVNGVTARELGIRTKWHQERVALCFVADVPLSRNEITNTMQTHDSEPAIELYFGMVPWGYGWCFPKSDEYSIGLGCRFDKSHSLESAWDMLVARIEHEKGIELDLANRTSYRVPLGGKIDRCVARRSMLIGDAAGLVSPMTGEGISYAIESGVLAARTSIDAVRTKSPLRVKEYENQVKGHMSRELADLRWLTGILHRSKRNVDLVCQIADEDPIMREYLTDLLARTRRFSDIKISLVKRLLTRHPLKAARLGLR